MKNEKELRSIKPQNYIITLIMIMGTIVLSFYILSWYNQYKETKISTPVITSFLSEVKYNELDTILSERDFLIIYACTSIENKCRSFENKFSSYIKKQDLYNNIVYLNLGYKNDNSDMVKMIYNKYKHPSLIKKLYGYPIIFVMNDGKIIDLLSCETEDVSIDKVKEFLEGYDL